MIVSSPVPWELEPYSIKRHGVTITNCDSEPVQTPGCVQAHGALLVLRRCDLTILQTSDNSGPRLGRLPAELLGRPVAVILGDALAVQLEAFLTREPVVGTPLFLATIQIPNQAEALDITVHTVGGVVVLEFEATGYAETRAPDYYTIVKRTAARLGAAASVREFCQISAEEVRRVSGLDRVMLYRFHSDDSGEVYAEDRRPDLPSWLGLHYPAHDIPKPSREIFKKIWIRPLPDARGELAELVPLLNPDTGQPLDMTYCALRGASVMYTEYLQNMGAAASLTMSILCENKLWGLIACHHCTRARLPYQVRAACELLAQRISLQLPSAEEREFHQYRARMDEVHLGMLARTADSGELDTMLTGRPALLDGIAATGAALYHRARWSTVGSVPLEPALDRLAEWLRSRPEFLDRERPVLETDSLATVYPPALEFADVASGLLAVPIARGPSSILLWFRPETVRTVAWGGNPHDMPTVLGPNGPRLTPRTSFALWQESVRLRSLPWLPVEVNAALTLRLMMMDLVVSRLEQLAALNAELSRSNAELDAFTYVAGHDLKEPLRGIRKYAAGLMHEAESSPALSEEGRERIAAIQRLTSRMEALLNSLLQYSRMGRLQIDREEVDMAAVLQEVLEMLATQPELKGVQLRVPRPLPTVRCDRVRLRGILSNLIGNACKYNDKTGPWVEVGFVDPSDTTLKTDAAPPGRAAEPPLPDLARVPIEARGQRIYYVRDNGIGIEPGHFEQIFKMFKRLHPREAYGGGSGAGLTISRKFVEQHGGKLWVESEPQVGSVFCFTLPDSPQEEPASNG